jgi:hypothetical protein
MEHPKSPDEENSKLPGKTWRERAKLWSRQNRTRNDRKFVDIPQQQENINSSRTSESSTETREDTHHRPSSSSSSPNSQHMIIGILVLGVVVIIAIVLDMCISISFPNGVLPNIEINSNCNNSPEESSEIKNKN